MVDLGLQEDWSDYMLIEWAAALELHQRGRVKAVLPLLVGETDFWSEAHAAFGGIQSLPTQVSSATMEKVVMHLEQTTGDDSAIAKRRAIRLLHLGLTTNEDMRLLTAYFAKLDAMVNKMTHVFISYRTGSDRQLARRLYEQLSEMLIDETGQRVRVYLDQTRLEDGQRWDAGFMNGLAHSWVFVPIVSTGRSSCDTRPSF